MNQDAGAWIFLSHSTRDWHSVRTVRNLLEEKGHKPLVFFLKCLTDHGELVDILKREIEARTWFLLCDSPQARESRYVQEEIEYIKQLPDKYYEEIELEAPLEDQVERIDRLCRRITIYLSYASADRDLASVFQDSLVRAGYSVWFDQALPSGSDFFAQIRARVDDALGRGFFMPLLTPNYFRSRFCESELRYALNHTDLNAERTAVVPVLLQGDAGDQSGLPFSFALSLAGMETFDVRQGDFATHLEKIVSHLKSCTLD